MEAKQKPSNELFLRAVTWTRDSHGLFDYESRHVTKQELKTHTCGVLQRKSNEVSLRSPKEALLFTEKQVHLPAGTQEPTDSTDEPQNLLQIVHKESQFEIMHPNEKVDEVSADRVWQVITKHPQQACNEADLGYKIKKFDVIKLGRFKFRVKDLHCEQMGMTEDELY